MRGITWLPILLIIGGVALAGILGFVIWQLPSMINTGNTDTVNVVVNTNTIACTEEAKLCPDGTAVGRTGPNCAFAPCPGASTNTTANTNNSANTNTTPTKASLTHALAELVSSGGSLAYTRPYVAHNLPANVLPDQVRLAFVSGDIVFAIAESSLYEVPFDRKIQWVGVLGSVDGGVTWEEFYSIPKINNVYHNIAGIFINGRKLYLDITDNNGAGSGEGNLTRLVSTNGGSSWDWSGCYYLTPERYFRDYQYTNEGYTPLNLQELDSGMCSFQQNTYTNSVVGFTLLYPVHWQVEETNDDGSTGLGIASRYTTFTSPNGYKLTVGVRRVGEDIRISGRTGTGAGDIVVGESMPIAGTTTQTQHLVYQDKIKILFYYPQGQSFVTINGHEVYADLGSTKEDYASYDLQDEGLQIAYNILKTLQFTE